MSMVLGIRHNGKVTMAVDSVAAGSEVTVIRKESKMYWNGQYLIGFVGSFRYGQVVKFTDLPEFPEELLSPDADENKVEGFFVRQFIPVLQDAVYDANVDPEDLRESSLMVAVGPHLFVIEPGFQIMSYVHDYAALGIAEQAALVALDVLGGASGDINHKLSLVLTSIEKHSVYVKAPFCLATT